MSAPQNDPDVRDDRRVRVLLDAVSAAGWEPGPGISDAEVDMVLPAGRARLTMWPTDKGQGVDYRLVVQADDLQVTDDSQTENDRVEMETYNARLIFDTLAGLGLIAPPQPLTAEDVRVMISKVAADRAVTAGRPAPPPLVIGTVYDWGDKYRRDERQSSTRPFPPAMYVGERVRSRPYWHPMDGPALIEWYLARPGQGVGGGRPRKDTP